MEALNGSREVGRGKQVHRVLPESGAHLHYGRVPIGVDEVADDENERLLVFAGGAENMPQAIPTSEGG